MNDFFCMLSALGAKGRGAASGLARRLTCAGTMVTAAMLHAPQAYAQASWKVIVPWRPPLVSVDVPVLFATQLTMELKSPVVVNQDTYDKHEAALSWSLAVAKEQPTLVLLSEELTLFNDAMRGSPRHIDNYEPLMMIWQSRWCLFTGVNSPLQRPEALNAWINDPAVPPMIAIPEHGGHMSIWLRGMERRTNRQWSVYVYGLKGSVLEAFDHGAGVALSYCNRQRLHPSQTRILAQSGPQRSEALPEVPLFSEIGWAPMAKGWLAWMVPKAMPAPQREKMAAALYRVMGKPAVQAQLRGTGHVVQHMDAAMSKQHIEDFSKTWRGIEALFSMSEEAVPAKPVTRFEPVQRQY